MPVFQQDQHHRRAENPRDEGRDRRARHAHPEAEDQDRVSGDVDHVHRERGDHRNSGVAHRAEQRRPGVIERDERIGKAGEKEIDQRVLENVRLHMPEDRGQKRRPEQLGESRHGERDRAGRQDQLFGGETGVVRIALADVLGRNHRASGRKRGEDIDDQDVDGVDERNARDGGLADA